MLASPKILLDLTRPRFSRITMLAARQLRMNPA
jgi:hypothetical protein